jgi:hypothetical protein
VVAREQRLQVLGIKPLAPSRRPHQSQKSTVMTFRSSRAGVTSPRRAPHAPQNRNCSGFSCPHDGQTTIGKAYGVGELAGTLSALRNRYRLLERPS